MLSTGEGVYPGHCRGSMSRSRSNAEGSNAEEKDVLGVGEGVYREVCAKVRYPVCRLQIR